MRIAGSWSKSVLIMCMYLCVCIDGSDWRIPTCMTSVSLSLSLSLCLSCLQWNQWGSIQKIWSLGSTASECHGRRASIRICFDQKQWERTISHHCQDPPCHWWWYLSVSTDTDHLYRHRWQRTFTRGKVRQKRNRLYPFLENSLLDPLITYQGQYVCSDEEVICVKRLIIINSCPMCVSIMPIYPSIGHQYTQYRIWLRHWFDSTGQKTHLLHWSSCHHKDSYPQAFFHQSHQGVM